MREISDKKAYAAISLISLAVIGIIGWLTYLKSPGQVPEWALALPGINACLNFSSAIFLSAGYVMIRRGNKKAHIACMATALTLTLGFLISYLVYHAHAGDTKFLGQGWIRPVYFFILISHIGLSIVNFPMALSVVFFALTGRFEKHKPLARITFPIWLYVSVTGVLVYFLLKPYRLG